MSPLQHSAIPLDGPVAELVDGVGRVSPGPLFLIDESGCSHPLNTLARTCELDGSPTSSGLEEAFVSPVILAEGAGRVIGMTTPDAGEEDSAMVSALVGLLAGIVSNGAMALSPADAGPELPCLADAASIVSDARSRLGQLTDEKATARVAVEAAAEALGAARVALFVPSEDGTLLEALAAVGIPAHQLRPRAREAGVLGWAAAGSGATLIEVEEDYPREFRVNEASGLEAWFSLPMVILPLRSGPECAGLLCVSGVPSVLGNGGLQSAAERLELLVDRTAANLSGTRLLRQLRHRERVGRELEIARQIQECLLPKGEFEAGGMEFAGSCRPAASVSGDWFGYKLDEDGRLTAALFDVAGHGIGAAVCLTMIRSVLNAALSDATHVADALTQANAQVFADLGGSGMYATAFVTRFDLVAGCVEYGSAGHAKPLHWSARERGFLDHPEGSLPLGLLEDSTYGRSSAELAHGDLFVTYTDGVSEARDEAGREFGRSRLMATLRRLRRRPARGILKGLWRALDEHTGGRALPDDATLTVVRMKPHQHPARAGDAIDTAHLEPSNPSDISS